MRVANNHPAHAGRSPGNAHHSVMAHPLSKTALIQRSVQKKTWPDFVKSKLTFAFG